MAQFITVTFTSRPEEKKQLEPFQLQWRLRDHSLAERFAKALHIACDREYKTGYMYKRERFYNFPNGYFTRERVISLLQEHIATINAAYPGLVDHPVHQNMTQEDMNKLHTYFEVHRGPLLNPSTYYKDGTSEVKYAFDEVNLLIHRFEDCEFADSENPEGNPRFVAAFGLDGEIMRYPLEDQDYQLFDLDEPYGCLRLNYCEVGKHLMDVFNDKDHEIGDEAIKPLRYYSADFFVDFNPNASAEASRNYLNALYEWWDENQEKLSALGFTKYDPKNAVGNIKLADLETKISHEHVVEEIGPRQWIGKVEISN